MHLWSNSRSDLLKANLTAPNIREPKRPHWGNGSPYTIILNHPRVAHSLGMAHNRPFCDFYGAVPPPPVLGTNGKVRPPKGEGGRGTAAQAP